MNTLGQAPAPEAPSSLSDDVAAAFRSVETGTSAPAAPAAPAASPSTIPAVRGPDGRFQPVTGTPGAAPGGPAPAPGTGVATPQPGAPTAPVPGQLGGPPAPGQPGAVTLDPSKPPQVWRPEMKEKWSTIPEDVRTEIIRREELAATGVQRLREQYQPMEELFNDLAQYDDYWDSIDRDPTEYLHEVIKLEQTLTTGNPAQKMQTLLEIGDMYGVPLREVLNSAMGGQLDALMQRSHQHHKTPAALPPEVEQELQALRQQRDQIVQSSADQELDQFLATEPPFFDHVADDMEQLLNLGVVETYQEAYDLAVFRNPQLRQQAVAMTNGQAQADALRTRQQAAGLITTPAPVAVTAVPQTQQGGSIDDDIRAAWNAHARNGVG